MNILKTIIDLLVNYGPSTFTAGIALFYLKKDWESFHKGYLRWLVLILICMLWVFGVFNIYVTDEKNDLRRAEDKIQIGKLTSAVKTAKESQESDTKQFIDAFGKLSQRVSTLQGEVKTAGLREEAKNLKADLEATQKALKPKNAMLEFTFITKVDQSNYDIIRDITLPVKDNVVHVDYKMLNKTDVSPVGLEVIILTCDDCDFASEPLDSARFPGQPKNQRNIKLGRMQKMSATQNLSVDIKVSPSVAAMIFRADYRCENCDFQDISKTTGFIKLQR